MFSLNEVKTESEEAEICLPVDHHLHSNCSDSHSTPRGLLESTPPELVLDRVKIQNYSSPARPSDQTSNFTGSSKSVRSQQNVLIKNETEFKVEPVGCFDDSSGEQKTKEVVILNQTDDEVLHSSEYDASVSHVDGPNTINVTNDGQRCTDSKPSRRNKTDEGHQKRKHVCELCGKGYVQSSHLGLHMRTHTGDERYRCQECGEVFSRGEQLLSHMVVHRGKKPFTCTDCGKGYLSSSTLKTHMAIHSGTSPFTCDVCGKGFLNAGHLRDHHRYNHAGERPHRCAECGSAFKGVSDLKRHQMIHARNAEAWHGGKTHFCEFCGRGYFRKTHLDVHMKQHTGKKDHRCPECGAAFFYAYVLKQHINAHCKVKKQKQEPKQNQICDKCGQSFTSVAYLNRHQKRASTCGERPSVQTSHVRRSLRSQKNVSIKSEDLESNITKSKNVLIKNKEKERKITEFKNVVIKNEGKESNITEFKNVLIKNEEKESNITEFKNEALERPAHSDS